MLCTPLNTVNPFLQDNATGILEIDEGRLEASQWVKYRIPGFSKLVGLSVERPKQLCITLLLKIEQELEAARVWKRGPAGASKVNTTKVKGARELRNLVTSVNYEGK